MKMIYWTSIFYLITGLFLGFFYREFTKMNNFQGTTVLGAAHGHIIALGFIFFLIVLILEKIFMLSQFKFFNTFFIIYNIGLLASVGAMVWRGILQVRNLDFNGLPHIAGTAHVILTAGFILFLMNLNKAITALQNVR